MADKNTICLWYDRDALDTADFYVRTSPDSKVTTVHRVPSNYPAGREGDVLTVGFTVAGIPCLGLDDDPQLKHSEAFSFRTTTDDQVGADRLWSAIVSNSEQESACG